MNVHVTVLPKNIRITILLATEVPDSKRVIRGAVRELMLPGQYLDGYSYDELRTLGDGVHQLLPKPKEHVASA